MRFRSTSQEQASSSPRATGPPDAASTTRSRGIGRKIVLLALGLVAAAYVATRYLGRSTDVPSSVQDLQDRVPSAETVRQQTTDAVPSDFQEIPIGEQSDEDADAEPDEGDSTSETGADAAAEGVDDAERNVEMTDGERSAAEISERADEDVPEPGEMAVDEDVADELVDADENDADRSETDEDEE